MESFMVETSKRDRIRECLSMVNVIRGLTFDLAVKRLLLLGKLRILLHLLRLEPGTLIQLILQSSCLFALIPSFFVCDLLQTLLLLFQRGNLLLQQLVLSTKFLHRSHCRADPRTNRSLLEWRPVLFVCFCSPSVGFDSLKEHFKVSSCSLAALVLKGLYRHNK